MVQRLHPEDYRTYVIDRNINYTNICTARCTFCAFRRNDKTAGDAYTLSHDAIYQKIAELVSIGGTQILMQGGMNPDLPIGYYEELLRGYGRNFRRCIFMHFRRRSLWNFLAFPYAGVGGAAALQGGGAGNGARRRGEIFSDRVRRRIGPGKCSGEQWLEVMSEAHKLGMHTSVTMLIGHIEDISDRIDH